MPRYVDGEELKREMMQAKETGVFSDRLVGMWKLMIQAVYATFVSSCGERDDYEQDCLINLMTNVVHKVNYSFPGNKVFNYVTSCLRNQGNQTWRTKHNYGRMLSNFKEDVIKKQYPTL